MSKPLKVNTFRRVLGYSLWAFTVKINKNGKQADEKSYEPFFKVLHNLCEVIVYCGEIDTKNILHYHGVIRIPDNFYRKNICVEGYHIYLKKIFNLRAWVDYCFKNNVLYCFENMKTGLLLPPQL